MIKNKKFLLDFAKNLQEYFTRLEFFSHAILCMCFISHQVRLIKDQDSTASEILENASELVLKPSVSRFCRAYLSYSKGRLVQQMCKNTLPNVKWEKKFEWEEKPSVEFWAESLQDLFEWQSEVCRPENEQKEKIERVVKLEKIEILASKFRDEKDTAKQNKNKEKLQSIIKQAEENVNELNSLLGSHGETAYAFKRLADLIFDVENEKERAASLYEKAYKMNEANKSSSAANALILRSWSRCFSDKEKALEKLAEAKKLLADYHMFSHSWYERVVESERVLLESLPD